MENFLIVKGLYIIFYYWKYIEKNLLLNFLENVVRIIPQLRQNFSRFAEHVEVINNFTTPIVFF